MSVYTLRANNRFVRLVTNDFSVFAFTSTLLARFDFDPVLGSCFCSAGPTAFERYCFAVVTHSPLETSHAANVGVFRTQSFSRRLYRGTRVIFFKIKGCIYFYDEIVQTPEWSCRPRRRARRRSKTIFFEQRPPRVDTVRNAFLPTFEPGQKYARVQE